MTRQIRWKALLLLLLVGAALAGGMETLRRRQVQSNAAALLAQADRCEAEQKLDDAAFYLRLYLYRRPGDVDARERLALLRLRLSSPGKERQEALQSLEDFLRQHPDREPVRRTLIQALMAPGVGRHAEARPHIQALLEKHPQNGELELLLGRCHLAEKRHPEAVKWLAQACQHAPKLLDAYILHAHVLRQELQQDAEADQVADRMVQNVATAEAHLARAEYRKKYGKPDDARADIDAARKLAPDNASVLLACALLAADRKEFAQARTDLERATRLHPRQALLYLAWADIEVTAGQLEAAITVLRQGLKQVPGHPALLWDLATLLLDSGQADEVGSLIVGLRKARMAEARIDYLDARTLIVQGRWLEAIVALERLSPLLQPWPELQKQASLLLGRCFGQLGDIDRQYAAFQRAVKEDPLWVSACLGLGESLELLGKYEEAAEAYRRIIPRAPRARLDLARVLIQQNLQRPASEQQWQPLEELLKETEKALPESRDDLAILRARMLIVRGRKKDARAELSRVRAANPDRVGLWAAEASIIQEDSPQAVLPLLDEAQRKVGDRLELRLARALYWSRQGKKGLEPLAALEEKVDNYSPAERLRLWRGLAEAHLRAGDLTGAVRLLSRAAAERRNDLGLRISLFDLALLQKDSKAIAAAIEEIRRIEGPDGAYWRYAQACQGINAGSKAGLAEAKRLLAEVARRRPGWSRVLLAEAEIAFLEGQRSTAIARFQKAVDQGERRPDVLGRLFVLLAEANRHDEARRVRALLPEHSPVLSQLRRFDAETSLQGGDPARALELARQAVAEDSRDFRDHLWLGQLLWQAKQNDEAEKRFRKAVALEPSQPAVWVVLVHFLASTGKKDEAAAVLKSAAAAIPPDQADLALAQCHESAGNTKTARELYEKALARRPRDPVVLRGAATFYVRVGELARAEPLLQSMIDLTRQGEDAAWARRTLALVLGLQNDPQKTRRALEQLNLIARDVREAGKTDTPDQLRARAIVLATSRNRKNRLEAVRVLKELAGRQPLTAEDRFLLARVQESLGDWKEARGLLLELVTSEKDNPVYLARYIRGLLRNDDADQAAIWVEKLARLQPDSFQTLALRCWVLKAQNRSDQAKALIQAYKTRDQEELLLTAGLLEEVGQATDAEEAYKRWVREAKKKGAELTLAQFYGRQNRTREALAVCDQARKTLPPGQVSVTAVGVLYASSDGQNQAEPVARWIVEALQKTPRDAALLDSLAAIRNLQGRHSEAIALYQQVLGILGDEAIALNNLAYLLALKENKGGEAMKLLERAEAVAGDLPDLLDTRAVIHLSLGQHAQAIQVLVDLLAERPSPLGYFHLAQAYHAARQRLPAITALNKAKRQGLKLSDLHPLERPAYQKLSADLGVP